MITHADVHEQIDRIISGTRLTSFMVTTNSFRSEDGSVAVEWACTISSGRATPEFFFRSRDADELVTAVRKGVDLRRPHFAIRALEAVRTPPPVDTAFADPKVGPRRNAACVEGCYRPTEEG
jgi:hypothetical protein